MDFKTWLDDFSSQAMPYIGNNLLLSVINPEGTFSQDVQVQCQCGDIRKVSLYHIVKKTTATCGRCNLSKAKQFGQTKFGELTLLDSIYDVDNSSRVTVKCSCGNIVENVRLRQLILGGKKSCGLCSVNRFKQLGQIRFGKLTLTTPFEHIKLFGQKVDVVCDCGNCIQVTYRNLAIGNSKSCGKCEIFSLVKSGITKWGKLTIVSPLESLKSLSQQAEFICNCGVQTRLKVYNVVSLHTTTCGRCYDTVKMAYDNKKQEIFDLKFPISPGKLFGVIQFNNIINSTNTKLEATCPICEKSWNPLFGDVRRGVSLSCGCSYHMTSIPQQEILEYVQSLGLKAECESNIGGLKYDVFVASALVAIEYHGLKWHSTTTSKKADLNKYRIAKSAGIELMVVYEDEWINCQSQLRDIISHRLKKFSPTMKLRPSQCDISFLPSHVADKFYGKHHYLGKTGSSMNLGAVYRNELMACMSFKRPTRQSKHDWELTRMASDPAFQVHGIWSKMFGIFINKHMPMSVVSFSDNRLFSGKVYEKLGFKYDGDVKPDYYWVKGRYRYNKSGLRKPPGTSCTENELRTSQGYSKIWDLGKKRWVWNK